MSEGENKSLWIGAAMRHARAAAAHEDWLLRLRQSQAVDAGGGQVQGVDGGGEAELQVLYRVLCGSDGDAGIDQICLATYCFVESPIFCLIFVIILRCCCCCCCFILIFRV